MGNMLCRLDCRGANVIDDTRVEQATNNVGHGGQPANATRVNDGPPPRRQSIDLTDARSTRDSPQRQNDTRPNVVKLDLYASSDEDVVVGSTASSIHTVSSQGSDLGLPEQRHLPPDVWENVARQFANEAMSGTGRPSPATVQSLVTMRKLNHNFGVTVQPLLEPVKQRVLSHKVTTAADLRRMLPVLATLPEADRINTLGVLLVRTQREGDGDFQGANATSGRGLVKQAILRLSAANQSKVVAHALETLKPNAGMMSVLGRFEGEGLLRQVPPEHQVEPLTRALTSIATRMHDDRGQPMQVIYEELEVVRAMANALPRGVGEELKGRLMNF